MACYHHINLFSVYIDDIVTSVSRSNATLSFNFVCMSVFLYADDILLISPSVSLMQKLVNIVENELLLLDMSINPKKYVCLRVSVNVLKLAVPIFFYQTAVQYHG